MNDDKKLSLAKYEYLSSESFYYKMNTFQKNVIKPNKKITKYIYR